MISASLLNSLRREGLEQLTAQRLEKNEGGVFCFGKRFPEENKRRKGINSPHRWRKTGRILRNGRDSGRPSPCFFMKRSRTEREFPQFWRRSPKTRVSSEKVKSFWICICRTAFFCRSGKAFSDLTEDLPVRIFPYLPAVTRGFDELRIESDLGKLSDLYDEKLIAGVAVSHRGQLSFLKICRFP